MTSHAIAGVDEQPDDDDETTPEFSTANLQYLIKVLTPEQKIDFVFGFIIGVSEQVAKLEPVFDSAGPMISSLMQHPMLQALLASVPEQIEG